MDAIEIIKEQHREVLELFEEYEKAKDRAPELRRRLVETIGDKLAIHMKLEEELVYPTIRGKKIDTNLIKEALEEHLSVKRLLADLLDMDPGDEQFGAKVLVLKEQLEHHLDEEEDEILPKIRRQIGTLRLERLGDEMMARMQELMRGGAPRESISAETGAAPAIE